jgi:uncharacterized protein
MSGSPGYEQAPTPLQARSQAALALLLVVPAQSLGVVLALILFPGIVGQVGAVICQIWMLALPIWWMWKVDRVELKFSRTQRREWLAGLLLGVAMFSIILLSYGLVGQHWLNATDIQDKVQRIGLTSRPMILASGFYFTVINSLFEEYVWRWFVYRQCEILFPKVASIGLSAVLFTVHHVIVLAVYGSWAVVGFGTLGVFAAGVIWSACYRRYRSIVPSYVSHGWADAALQIITWLVLF